MRTVDWLTLIGFVLPPLLLASFIAGVQWADRDNK